MRWSDEEFLAEVQRRFGFRLGRFLKVGRRVAYPLSLTRAQRTSAPTLRRSSATPRKGCIRSPAWDSTSGCAMWHAFRSSSQSIGAPRATWAMRRCWRRTMAGAPRIDAASSRSPMGWCGCSPTPLAAVQRLRNLGLLAFDLLPPAKAALSSLSTGVTGRIPKLARGVALAMSREFDVVIVGAGATGTVMASLLLVRKLAETGRVAIVAESRGSGDRTAGAAQAASADWDLRVFALSRASQRLLQLCGVWQALPTPECLLTNACACGTRAAHRRAPAR